MITSQEIFNPQDEQPMYTGKQLVMMEGGSKKKSMAAAKKASINLASFDDYASEDADYTEAFEEADGIVFEQLGIMVVNEEKQEEVSAMLKSTLDALMPYSEPERYVYALGQPSSEFMRGYKAAVDHLYSQFDLLPSSVNAERILDDKSASWGILATLAHQSAYTGKGVNLAVLDTGFNLNHADFANRNITTASFISGEGVMDENGHGSHCAGIAGGYINRITKQRYGVAKDCNLFIGKVLSNKGSGTDSGILAGIEWAMQNKCKVISMSLGARTKVGDTYSKIYNDIAVKANAAGTIIIAAAGNDSKRDVGLIMPVSHPANCPAIMAVGAIDSAMKSANFSCSGLNLDGGKVDIAGPGVDIYSSWKPSENYKVISGTSMATPYVAGFAALFWESFPAASASEIWMYMMQRAKALDLSAADVGAGLVAGPL